MLSFWLLISLTVLVAIAATVLLARKLWVYRQECGVKQARQEFHRRREWLEARFLTLAGESGRPRGLAWSDCEFDDEVSFARDRVTGQLRALVAVTISFEAVAGGGMEEVEAVGNRRAATSVFRYEGGKWVSDGWAVFNLNPVETIRHFRHELEMVE